MSSDQWFAVKRNKKSRIVYLITGGDRRRVEEHCKSMFHSPIIVKLTWGMMHALNGCNTPGDKLPTDFCRGQIMIPRDDKIDIIYMAL